MNFFIFTLVVIAVLVVATTARKFGKHDFPLYTPHGVATANEFQFIQPENIKDARKVKDGDYVIKSVSPTLIDNDEVVTVTFSALKPLATDWIAAYSPANVDIKSVVPVKYGYCDDSADYLTTGSGFLTFNMTNLRNDVAFYYYTNGLSTPVLVATTDTTVKFKNINQPLRPRVVPTGDLNVFNLLWSSATSTKPIMKWGTSPGHYTHKVSAATSRIDKSEVCGAPANTIGWFDLGLIHTAEMVGMEKLANKKIYYVFGDEDTNDFSGEHIFNAPPLPGTQPPNRPTRVIMYDDLGRGSTDMSYTWYEYGRPAVYTMMAVGDEVRRGEIDAIYHGGDISYATGYISVWDFYMDMMAPVASGTLYLTTVGNHESDWYNSATTFNNSDSGGECGVMTTRLIPMPAPATTNKPWWSYEVGLIHFIGISTEHDYTIGSEQYNWFKKDLESIDRTKTPWVIFGGHRAMYLNSNYGGSVSSDLVVMDSMIANLEALLFEHRVNIGFYGHNHVVQRQAAVYNKTLVQKSKDVYDSNGKVIHLHENPQSTVHMVIGTGGASFTKNAVEPKPDWNEMYMYEYGYARVTAVNASYLDWEWVLSSTGEVLDHMVLTQDDPTKPWKL